jgi:hypothetical protein
MIFKTIRLAAKVVTVASAVTTGYSIYKKSRKIYSGYKRAKKVTDKVTGIAQKASDMIKPKK